MDPQYINVSTDSSSNTPPSNKENFRGQPSVGEPSIRVKDPRLSPWDLNQRKVEKEHCVERKASDSVTYAGRGYSILPINPLVADEASAFIHQQKLTSHPPSLAGGTGQISPQIHSPASLIFERSVQEHILPVQASPSIPTHIRTENHIPPVLEASSVAITSDNIDPDSVEIITHSLHQPAVVGVSGASVGEQALPSAWLDDAELHSGESEGLPSPSTTMDATDVRRLSFISFADVINAENLETGEPLPNHDSSQNAFPSGNPNSLSHCRTPSPYRSPASPHGLSISPPTSISASPKRLGASPNRGNYGGATSPLLVAQSPHSPLSPNSEFNIETMRQALKRTGSGDLSGAKSQTSSALGHDDAF